MHKKYHEKFKILDILAVTTQAREGIETRGALAQATPEQVTTQAREGIETSHYNSVRYRRQVTTQAREGIETAFYVHLGEGF